MQAIRTRYVGPTNTRGTRGTRIQAKCEAKTIAVSYDHALDAWENHKAACMALVSVLGWGDTGAMRTVRGGNFGGDTYWVFTVGFASLGTSKGE